MKFSEHLKYLSEDKINEANENDQTFSEEVKNFFLDKFTFTRFEKNNQYIIADIGSIKKIGEFQCRVEAYGENKIFFSFIFFPVDVNEYFVLNSSKVISTTTKDYQKFSEKWFKDTTAIVEKISALA